MDIVPSGGSETETMNLKKMLLPAAAGLATIAGNAMAATTIDTSSITDVVTAVAAAAAIVGAAVLGMHYGIKAYKWLRGAG